MNQLRTAFVALLFATMGLLGCGNDACTAEESTGCTNQLVACQAACSPTDGACMTACGTADCDCHAMYGCPPGSSCP